MENTEENLRENLANLHPLVSGVISLSPVSIHPLQCSLSLSPRRCFSLTKTSHSGSLFPLGSKLPQQLRPPQHPLVITIISPPTPEVQRWPQPKVAAAVTGQWQLHRHLPSPFPATTGLRFQRHHDQKNRINALYTKVQTISPFLVVEKSTFYCASSPFASRLLFVHSNGSGRV